MDTQEVGKELKGLRAKNGYSRKDVYELTKIHRETLRKYESDAVYIPLNKLLILLNLYNVPVDIFFDQLCANKH